MQCQRELCCVCTACGASTVYSAALLATPDVVRPLLVEADKHVVLLCLQTLRLTVGMCVHSWHVCSQCLMVCTRDAVPAIMCGAALLAAPLVDTLPRSWPCHMFQIEAHIHVTLLFRSHCRHWPWGVQSLAHTTVSLTACDALSTGCNDTV